VTSREGFERALNEALGQVPPTPQTLDSTVIPTQNKQIVVAAALPGDALAVNLPWGTWEWASLEQGRLMWPVTGIGRWLAVAGAEQATVTTRSVAGLVALVWLITWLVAGTAIARSTAEALRSDSGSSLPVRWPFAARSGHARPLGHCATHRRRSVDDAAPIPLRPVPANAVAI
jgi:hypothetical protein